MTVLSVLTLSAYAADKQVHEATFLFPAVSGIVTKDLKFEVVPSRYRLEDTFNIDKSNDKLHLYSLLDKYGFRTDYRVKLDNDKVKAITNSIKNTNSLIASHVTIDPNGNVTSVTNCTDSKCTTVNNDLCTFIDEDLDRHTLEKLNSCAKGCDGLEQAKIPGYVMEEVDKSEKENLESLSYALKGFKPKMSSVGLKKVSELSTYLSSLNGVIYSCGQFKMANKIAGKSAQPNSPKKVRSPYMNKNLKSASPQ